MQISPGSIISSDFIQMTFNCCLSCLSSSLPTPQFNPQTTLSCQSLGLSLSVPALFSVLTQVLEPGVNTLLSKQSSYALLTVQELSGGVGYLGALSGSCTGAGQGLGCVWSYPSGRAAKRRELGNPSLRQGGLCLGLVKCPLQ